MPNSQPIKNDQNHINSTPFLYSSSLLHWICLEEQVRTTEQKETVVQLFIKV